MLQTGSDAVDHKCHCVHFSLFLSSKCVQGLVQLEIGRLRAGSWASSRKTSQNSQVVDVFPAHSLTLGHPPSGEVAHFISGYLEMMSDARHSLSTSFSACS